jgi:6-phosphogluconate dehydrogenase
MKNEKTKPKEKIKLGVIGLGIMGSSIASNLQK